MGEQKENNHKISLIFPVSNEAHLLDDLKRIEAGFKKVNQDWEAIAILDSGLKKSTPKLKTASLSNVKTFFYPLKRFGLGFAFCYGYNQSSGSRVFFWEANFNISPKQLLLYLDLMDLVKADIVVGSKRHPLSSVSYSPFRRTLSGLYQLLVRTFFHLNLSDTQVGLKLYQRRVLEKVIPRIIIKNWAFDLEILVVAHNLGFKRIVEAPIEFEKSFPGREVTPGSIINLLKDTLAIYYRKYILKYYHQKPV